MTDNTKLTAELRERAESVYAGFATSRVQAELRDAATALEAAGQRITELEAGIATAVESVNAGVAEIVEGAAELEAERDALAAVIEQAKGHLNPNPNGVPLKALYAVRDLLASADTGAALREVRAKAIEDWAADRRRVLHLMERDDSFEGSTQYWEGATDAEVGMLASAESTALAIREGRS